MITVELRQVRFFAYHGLHPEEKKTGNEFEITLSVSYEPEHDIISDIHSTINYVRLYELVQAEMRTPVDLLETLAANIAGSVKSAFPQTKNILVSITKLNPPIAGFFGKVKVILKREF